MAFIDSVYDAIKSRLSNPFLGSLFLAVLALHWKFFYALCAAEGNVAARLAAAHQYPYPTIPFALDSRMTSAVLTALFFTFGWPVVDGLFKLGRARIDLFFLNLATKQEAKRKLETAATLQQRPEWQELSSRFGKTRDELSRRVDQTFDAMRALWRRNAARFQFQQVDLVTCHLERPFEGFLPQLFRQLHPSSPSAYEPYYEGDARKDLILALHSTGPNHVLGVSLGGLVPWQWGDTNARWLRFEHGRAVVQPGDPPPLQHIEPNGRAILIIVRFDRDFGCYVSSDRSEDPFKLPPSN